MISSAVLLRYRFIGEDVAYAEHHLLFHMPLQPLPARLILQQPSLVAPHHTQTSVAISNSEESGIGRTFVCERERARVRAVHTLAMHVRAIHTRTPAHAHARTRRHAHAGRQRHAHVHR